MKMIIGGDLVPTKSNIDLFNSGNISELIGESLLSIWDDVDFKIFNLEVPLADRVTPIDKCGPNLISPTSAIKGIKALNPSLITLANNHILDHGIEGLNSTVKVLTKNNIPYVGVGENLNTASKPYILEHKGIKVGVYACSEHEFSIATKDTPGANPFDLLESFDHIRQLKEECDRVIVLYHGGKEHYQYPSPILQKVCRKIVENGADLVICQHSHCIGCEEVYKGSTIVYGQGNFIFDGLNNEFWNTGLLLKVNINEALQVDYIPIIKKGNTIRLATDRFEQDILESFYNRSREILKDNFIEQQYQIFADKALEAYFRKLLGFGKWLGRIDRFVFKGRLSKHRYSKSNILAIQNAIECESHRELMLTGLKNSNK
ncbi:CapA family protein [Bacillus sp. Marseille-P3661]|uniref:CapA family protein n=1 Tax=Bacillus sp. Marseille-P3661 TaxID=1936234 RepID=UPI000C86236B|nr:CapA family protein [Bacillus sp. Marseille-P3661]